MSSVLREKAGADTYNRFEYQVHWIVYHMLERFQNDEDFIIFCEYHDDMAECSNFPPDSMSFFQIKTKEKDSLWSFSALFNKNDKQHSFLGYIYYNFLTFQNECNCCCFISNRDFNDEILRWQSLIKDGKLLYESEPEIYSKIFNKIKEEFPGEDLQSPIFIEFIQNTFLTRTDLPLETHNTHLMGVFFKVSSKFSLYQPDAYRFLTDILDEVRKKSKRVIKTPISFNELVNQKGISSESLRKLEKGFNDASKYGSLYNNIENYLLNNGKDFPYVKHIIRYLKKHHYKMLDLNDSLYQDSINQYCRLCLAEIETNIENFVSFPNVENILKRTLTQVNYQHSDINKSVMEGIFYEILLSS